MSGSARTPFLLFVLLIVSHVGMEWRWHRVDAHLPDGDESGHLGAVELYRDIIRDRGLLEGVREAFASGSEYPPLFALAYALPLAYLGPSAPFPAGVDGLLVFWSVVTLCALAGLTRSVAHRCAGSGTSGRGPPAAAFLARGRTSGGAHRVESASTADYSALLAAFVLVTSPLAAALSRHLMPETFLSLCVILVLWAGVASEGLTRPWASGAFGAAIASALMTKQTAVLYLGAPILFFGWKGFRALPKSRSSLVLAFALGCPIPLWWLGMHWDAQRLYLTRSAAAKASISWLEAFFYHPVALFGLGLGIFWSILFGIAVVGLIRRVFFLPLVALVVNLVILGLVPKKYPRLDVPLIPQAAMIIGLGLMAFEPGLIRRVGGIVAVGVGVVPHLLLSFVERPRDAFWGVYRPAFFSRVDPDCPQEWIRPASREALGFERVLALLKEKFPEGGWGTLVFIGIPPFPCSYETTFGWDNHLMEYLRRHGVEFSESVVIDASSGFSEEASEDDGRVGAALEEARVVISGAPWCEAGKGEADGRGSEVAVVGTRDLFDPLCAARGSFGEGTRVDVRAGGVWFGVYVHLRR